MDRQLLELFGLVLVVLVVATAIGRVLRRKSEGGESQATIQNLNARINAWWGMIALFSVAVLTGGIGSILLFTLTSFLALREFVTLTPTKRGDHRALFWAFFVVIPIQYLLVAFHWYGMFAIFIPVYAYLFIPIRIAAAGDCERFLSRTAVVQWGLMVCVYFVSHVPALLLLEIPGYERQNAKLFFFLVTLVELSDVLQYVFGKTLGKRKIAPLVSPNKTWEGFLGGVLTTSIVGACLAWATPFTPLQAWLLSLLIALMGFFGGLVMSAIKRDRGVKDYGTLIAGHGGVLDRIDSLCFAAPIFFHVVRYFFSS